MLIVGISASMDQSEGTSYLNLSYSKTFTSNKMVSMIIPSLEMHPKDFESPNPFTKRLKDWAQEIISSIDILVLSGGSDVNPVSFEKENTDAYHVQVTRDLSEHALFAAAVDKQIPVFGICRGMQLIGQILKVPNFQQDLDDWGEKHSGGEIVGVRAEPLHSITLRGGLQEYCQSDKLLVNSFHHQGFTFCDKQTTYTKATIARLESERPIKILAHTDQVIEAFEHRVLPIFAVQWHPEEVGADSVPVRYFFEKVVNRVKVFPAESVGPSRVVASK